MTIPNNTLKYFKETEKIPSKIYYHYTSLEALYEIVKSKTFRLMSLKSSNDKKELYYKPETFLQDFDSLYNQISDEDIKKQLALCKESSDKHNNEFKTYTNKKPEPYALCLSSKKDNLTHWDRYANGCKGVCIGFNVSSLEVYHKRFGFGLFEQSLFRSQKTLYLQQDIELEILNEMMSIILHMEKGFSKYKNKGIKCKDINSWLKESGFTVFAAAYSNIRQFVKNDSFIDESEVRVYYDANFIKEALEVLKSMKNDLDKELYNASIKFFNEYIRQFGLNECHFAITRAGIRSYRNMCLEKIWGSGVIHEIMLGPMCRQNRNELIKFLKHYGLQGTKVTTSNVPIQ